MGNGKCFVFSVGGRVVRSSEILFGQRAKKVGATLRRRLALDLLVVVAVELQHADGLHLRERQSSRVKSESKKKTKKDTDRLSFAARLAALVVQVDDVLEHGRVPHAAVERVHGVVAVALLQAAEGRGVVDLVQELAQHGRLRHKRR